MKPVDLNSVAAFEADFKKSEYHEPFVYHEEGDSVQCAHGCCDALSDNYSFGAFLKSSGAYARIHNRCVFEENQGWDLVDKMNEYPLFPKFLFQTENHLAFEWLHDWEVPTVEDFITPETQLRRSLNLEVTELAMSSFFHEFLEALKEFHTSGLTVDQIQLDDFAVKRDDTGNIIDWKYVRVTSVAPVRPEIDIPRYLFVLEPSDPDDTIYDEIQDVDPSLVYIHAADRWYEYCTVESV